MSSPTQRTLALLRKNGYFAQVVEKTIPRIFTKVDLFGCIDVVAIRADVQGVYGVQCTSASNQASRLKKILASEEMRCWVRAGNHLEVHGWSKKGAKGKRKLWAPNILAVTIADFLGSQ